VTPQVTADTAGRRLCRELASVMRQPLYVRTTSLVAGTSVLPRHTSTVPE
jgi:hypothetical protein